MNHTARIWLLGLAFLATGCHDAEDTDTESVEITDYSVPKSDDTLLVADRIEDKKTRFDAALIDRRTLHGWSLNASDAVISLDVPIVKPDRNPEFLTLHPSYAAAVGSVQGRTLPSVNMIDGKAKQFDDGLYAALDQAYFVGHGETMKSHLETLRRIHQQVAPGSTADDYMAAGLSLVSGESGKISPNARSLATDFLASEVRSKPIGFYTWNPTLSDTFRVLRYFAQPILDPKISLEITRVLTADQALHDDYVKAYTFYAKLTNPLDGRTPADLVNGPPLKPGEAVSLFPPSTSREVVLFEALFPTGLPAGANLMRELITAIRSGKVDLKPNAKSGWYEYQAFALETMLLPERGPESDKLLLSKAYKKRMLEAFQALITKRRETHSRQLKYGAKSEAPPPELESVEPRLRVEPNPTYYLRTARSYAFLANFLESTLGEVTLKSLKGLREGGEREKDLHAELAWMQRLFYGLYLLSAEDIGMKAGFLEGETVDREASEKVATDWLGSLKTDADLAVDTRVSVPIYHDLNTGIVRLWMTVGVRMTPLETSYVKPPSLKPAESPGDWQPVDLYKLKTTRYLIPVDEFAEVEIHGNRVLNRVQLREVCDQMKTKAKIVEAIQKL